MALLWVPMPIIYYLSFLMRVALLVGATHQSANSPEENINADEASSSNMAMANTSPPIKAEEWLLKSNEETARKMFTFAYCVYERTEELQANCLRNKLSAHWEVALAGVQECDENGNECAFLVAASSKEAKIVVSFRGTTTLDQTIREAVDSVKHGCIPFKEDSQQEKGYVNKYFYSALVDKHTHRVGGTAIWEQILQAIEILLKECDDGGEGMPKFGSVLFTGHSLGGAFASLAALRMHEHLQQNQQQSDEQNGPKQLRVEHFSFGQPRVGCPLFAAYFERSIPHSYRFVHRHDMVPYVPPESLTCTKCNPTSTQVNYRHHGQPIAVKNKPCTSSCVGCTRCRGPLCWRLLVRCADWMHYPRFVTDHFEYFNLNIQEKVSISTFLDIGNVNMLLRRLRFVQWAQDMLAIARQCLSIGEMPTFMLHNS